MYIHMSVYSLFDFLDILKSDGSPVAAGVVVGEEEKAVLKVCVFTISSGLSTSEGRILSNLIH